MFRRSFYFPIFLIFLSILLLAGGVVLYVVPERESQPVLVEGQVTDALAKITLQPSQIMVKPGQEFEVNLVVDTKEALVNVFAMELNFPPEELQFINLSKDESVASIWFEEHVWEEGKIFLTAGKPSPGFKGQGRLVRLKFKAIKAGQTEIGFGPGSAVYRNEDNKNILGETGNAQIEIVL